jgi:ATP-dependent DNA helicase RecG
MMKINNTYTIPINESETVEFQHSFQAEVIETLVAFSNAKGGCVYIGVQDDGTIKGVEISQETVVQWINEVKTKTSPTLIPDGEVLDVNGKIVVMLKLQEYPIKPVSFRGKYYKRVKNSNHLLSTTEVVNMHLQTFNTSWDAYPDLQHSLEDLSFEKIQDAIDKKKSFQKFLQDDPLSFLYKCGLVRDEKITNAAFLLFHKEDSYLSTIELGRFQSEILIKDTARSKSDVLTQIDQVIDFVRKHINLEVIITGQPQNTQKWQYPMEAIREIVINMVLHRDYRSSSDSIVKVFDDHIEFYNPGRLPDNITIDDLISDKYRSTPRNKMMADFLKDIGIIEKYCLEAGLPQPSFTNISDGFMVTVYSSQTREKSVVSELNTSFVKSSEKSSEKIINELINNKNITISELSLKLSVSTRAIEKQLDKLKQKGIIRRMGPDKGGYWQIINE